MSESENDNVEKAIGHYVHCAFKPTGKPTFTSLEKVVIFLLYGINIP